MKLVPTRSVFVNALALAFCATVAWGAPKTYTLDPARSSVGFTSTGFFTKVPGTFSKFEGKFTFDGDHPESGTLSASIEVGSIDTAEAKRDTHLRSPDFFDVAKFPVATFKSKSWARTGADTYDVLGDLTLHGLTREVLLKVTSLGNKPGAQSSSTLSQWQASATLKRSDFAINGTAIMGKMIGDEVKLTIKVTAEAND